MTRLLIATLALAAVAGSASALDRHPMVHGVHPVAHPVMHPVVHHPMRHCHVVHHKTICVKR